MLFLEYKMVLSGSVAELKLLAVAVSCAGKAFIKIFWWCLNMMPATQNNFCMNRGMTAN